MGHARVDNLSKFFVRRLYAKGVLSIADCVKAMIEKGETVHASEGEYDDEGTLCYVLVEVVRYLAFKYADVPGGPWIMPVLDTMYIANSDVELSGEARRLVVACSLYPDNKDGYLVTADKLEDDGLSKWSTFVRTLPEQRRVHQEWVDSKGYDSDNCDDLVIFNSIVWRFAPSKRQQYKDVPILRNIEN